MKLDRALQRELLNKLSEVYPEGLNTQPLVKENPDVASNLFYLRENGLITGSVAELVGAPSRFIYATITASGIDFLADDGGLSAILGVVTIKLHDDTIRQLIETRIQSAALPETTKSHLLKSLREAPGETIKQLTEKLLDAGLENWPTAFAAIQKLL